MRVVDAIADWFSEIGVEHYFGYAGGAIWPFMDALVDHPEMEGIQTKVESHAVHMADIYYRSTGKLAPVIVTKGPGLLNCVGGAATAMHDTSALMIIAGCGSTHFFGKAGMQEIYYHGFEDAVNVFRPVTKGTWLVIRPDTVIDVLNQAYKQAMSGRPGPVFVQIPFDIQLAEVEGSIEGPTTRSISSGIRPDRDSVARTVELLKQAQRPVFLAGGGVVRSSGGAEALKQLVEKAQIPVVTTLTAKGVISEEHPLSAGTVGRSGTLAAARTTREADLVVAVGARFSDNHTSNWRQGKIYDVPRTKIVQVDLETTEVARNYPVEVGIMADARAFLDDLAEAYDAAQGPDRSSWLSTIDGFRSEWKAEIQPLITATSDPVHPARLVHEVGEALGDRGRVFIDVGDVIQYAEPYMTVRGPETWNINPGMAEMSWATSGVLGAVAADRSRPAIALTGDGAFNMASNVLATAVEYDLPGIWVILNNYELGIEKKGSERGYKRVHPWTQFVRKDSGEPYNPDYVMLAEANGAMGERVERAQDLAPALARAIASGRPYVIDVLVDNAVPSYFTQGIDRAYPDKWRDSYPAFGQLHLPE
jgi:acetolactate synthase-1/2/3 large subunit